MPDPVEPDPLHPKRPWPGMIPGHYKAYPPGPPPGPETHTYGPAAWLRLRVGGETLTQWAEEARMLAGLLTPDIAPDITPETDPKVLAERFLLLLQDWGTLYHEVTRLRTAADPLAWQKPE